MSRPTPCALLLNIKTFLISVFACAVEEMLVSLEVLASEISHSCFQWLCLLLNKWKNNWCESFWQDVALWGQGHLHWCTFCRPATTFLSNCHLIYFYKNGAGYCCDTWTWGDYWDAALSISHYNPCSYMTVGRSDSKWRCFEIPLMQSRGGAIYGQVELQKP